MFSITNVLVGKPQSNKIVTIKRTSQDLDITRTVIEEFCRIREIWELKKVRNIPHEHMEILEVQAAVQGLEYWTDNEELALFWQKWFMDYEKNLLKVKNSPAL